MFYGIFTTRGDGYTYSHNQLEFITDDLNKESVSNSLEKLGVCYIDQINLLTSPTNNLDSADMIDPSSDFTSVYIEELDIV